MHYGGYTVDLAGWRAFADRRGLRLIEDASHSPGVGQVGRLSDAAAFSFFSNKNMTTCEGGMVLASETSVLDRLRLMRSHGMSSVTLDRHRGHADSYDVTLRGYNYRMDELRAAMGLVQLERLEGWNRRRKELSDHYLDVISDRLSVVKTPFAKRHETSAHLMPIILPEEVDRHKVMDVLRQNGVQSSIHYPPVHRFSFYQELFPNVSLPKTEHFAARELTLPLHPGLNESDVERVVGILRKAVSNVK